MELAKSLAAHTNTEIERQYDFSIGNVFTWDNLHKLLLLGAAPIESPRFISVINVAEFPSPVSLARSAIPPFCDPHLAFSNKPTTNTRP